ncbi:MAG: hypothetical protein WBV69_12040 [Candidatus Sulfotelmatobacter sp.]
MFRTIASRLVIFCLISAALALFSIAAEGQKQDGDQDKHLDIRSNVGDLHVGNDADARKAGLPLYPGARLRHDQENDNAANLSLFTQAFGVKLVLAKYDSDDAPAKIIDFYRDKLKKYGKVIECRTREHAGAHADFSDDQDSKEDGSKGDDSKKESAPVKCGGDNAGPVTELKVGTENNQHVVAIEPKTGSGSTFALVYVHTRGKQGDI